MNDRHITFYIGNMTFSFKIKGISLIIKATDFIKILKAFKIPYKLK